MSIYAWRYFEWGPYPKFIIPILGFGRLERYAFTPGQSDEVLRGAFGDRWPVNEPLIAVCHRIWIDRIKNPSFIHQEVPAENCRCGIYALKKPNRSAVSFSPDGMHTEVLGIVEIWGKIIQAKYGYRAEIAQLRAVVNTPASVSTTYNVPNFSSIRHARQEFMMNEEVNTV